MLSAEDLAQLNKLTTHNPEYESTFSKLSPFSSSEISRASHDIKNHIACLKTSYQLINKKIPDLSSNSYWIKIGIEIDNLNTFMERTSLYRYSTRNLSVSSVNINDIIYSIPDMLDDTYDNSCSFSFNLKYDGNVNMNEELAQILIFECTKNACEAMNNIGIITFESDYINNSIHLRIINQNISGITQSMNPDTLCQPFYSTKNNHIGLGLSIVHQICLTYKMQLSIIASDNETVIELIIPF